MSLQKVEMKMSKFICNNVIKTTENLDNDLGIK